MRDGHLRERYVIETLKIKTQFPLRTDAYVDAYRQFTPHDTTQLDGRVESGRTV